MAAIFFLLVSIAVWIIPSASGISAGSTAICANNDNCVQNTGCDTTYNTCRKMLGEACTNSNECLSTLSCSARPSSAFKCRIPAGSTVTCANNDDNCVENTECDTTSNTCRKILGQSCSNSNDCQSTLSCRTRLDYTNKKSRKIMGQCLSTLSCSTRPGSTNKCRIPAGGPVSCVNNNDYCVQNTVCDTTDICRKTLGQSCSNSNECLSKLSCSTRPGPTNKKCRIPAGSTVTCANNDDNCVENTGCDTSSNTCRKILGQSCSNSNDCLPTLSSSTIPGSTNKKSRKMFGQGCSNSNECLSTLSCSTRTGSTDNKCRIPAGGPVSCVNNNDYCVQNTVCDTTNICKKILGQGCSNSDDCLSTLSCSTRPGSTNKCQLGVEKPCNGVIESRCKSGTTCVNVASSGSAVYQCRIPVGSTNCGVNDDNCLRDAVCDSATCKLDVGKTCTGVGDTNCKSGTTCVNVASSGSADYQCRIPVGSTNCDGNDNCVRDAVCDSGTCKLDAGKTCTGGSDTNCKSGTTCVNVASSGSADYQCRIPVGSTNCEGNDHCVRDAVCDSGTCKLDAGKTCTGGSDTNCKSGTTCVNVASSGSADYQCRIPVGSTNCEGNDHCVRDAVCDSGTCKLDAGKTCTGGSDTNCKSGTTCVNVASSGSADYQCRIPVGSTNCEGNDHCVRDAVCDSGTCKSVNTGAIVGGVLAFLAVVVIIIILVVIVYRRRHRPKDLSTNQQPVHQVEDILHDQKSVSLIQYPVRVELLHRNSNHYFKQEYQELLHEENAFNYTFDVGKLDINKVKNRSAQICPHDYTRVKLFSQDDLGQDYINASYIVGLRSPCDYLATQGPMLSTISDFWKMVLDHRSTVIVMLSGSTDDGLSKVDQYWPHALNVSVRYGKVNVTMTSMATLPKYTLRNFSVCTNEQDELKVSHFQLMGWEVQGSTFSLEEVADTLYDVGERTSSPAGPVTVHCSDGTARTGSFIALDLLRTYVTQHALGEEVDVFHILLNIIKCRPRMVQSERQYMFIHDVLRVMVERKMRDEQGRREVYQNVGFGESSVYDTTYSYVPEGSVYETIGNKTPSATTGV